MATLGFADHRRRQARRVPRAQLSGLHQPPAAWRAHRHPCGRPASANTSRSFAGILPHRRRKQMSIQTRRSEESPMPSPNNPAFGAWLGLAALVVVGIVVLSIIFGSWYTVDQTQRAVLLRNGAFV